MELSRTLDLRSLLEKKSFFLFGPRATGKSFLVRKQLGNDALVVDLLRGDLYHRLSGEPHELEGLVAAGLAAGKRLVVIDEIQRIPELLNEVHRLIEERGVRFLLTGSSARKLRRGGANLLAGRAWRAELYPLTARELPRFDLDRYLLIGGLPPVQLGADPAEELSAYVHTYLYEEIQAEGLVRKVPQFSRFLRTAALANGQPINFAALASDTGVPASSIREYYTILSDTLLGFALEPWTKSKKRKATSTAKFYFFDIGVAHALCGTKSLERNSDLYGRAFEHWVGLELRAWLGYSRADEPLAFWRSSHGYEVDFTVGDRLAIEVKATQRVGARDLRGLLALREEGVFERYLLVSQDPLEAIRDGIRCLHWRTFLAALASGELTESPQTGF